MTDITLKTGKENGFSLIELLVAIAVGSIVMALIATAFWSQSQTSKNQQLSVGMQQNIRSAMFFIQQNIVMAGYADESSAGVQPTITIANSTMIEFTYADPDMDQDGIDNDGDLVTDEPDEKDDFNSDCDGTTDELSEEVTVQIFLNGQNQIVRQYVCSPGDVAPIPGRMDVIADNIQNLEFYYTLTDGTASTNTDCTGTDPDCNRIRKVGISILAQTASPNTGFIDTQTYSALSGAVWGPFNGTDPADPNTYRHIRREIATTTVLCRNMISNS